MSAYVSEKLDINYSVPRGLIYMLAGITGKETKEVWCELSEVANVCAKRLLKKERQRHSWTKSTFTGTDIELRINMKKFRHPKLSFKCEIKFGKTKMESFTQEQVNEYITENILLGAND